MESLIQLLGRCQEEVVARAFALARAHGYAQDTTGLVEVWRSAVHGLTRALEEGLLARAAAAGAVEPSADPMTRFGREEALRHRARGVQLATFLGLTKDFRDAFLEVCTSKQPEPEARLRTLQALGPLFDRIELAFCDAWAQDVAKVGSAALESANRTLAREKNHYLTILETIQEAVLVIEPSGRLAYANPPALRLGGQAAGPGAASVGPALEALRSDPPAWLRPFLHSSGKGSAQVSVPTPEGPRTLLTELAPIRDAAGATEAVLLVARDVTDFLRAESQARASARLEAVGRLTSGIAHEINTPVQFVGDSLAFLADAAVGLSALMGELLQRAPALPAALAGDPWWGSLPAQLEALDAGFLVAEVPRAIDRAREGVTRVAELVRAVKEFGHPGTDQPVPADLERAVRNTLAVSRPAWKHVATVSLEAGGLPPVRCHVEQLAQVVLNLVVNAADAIAERRAGTPGRLTVRTRQEGADAVVEVEDTGVGIPPEHQARVFEPFFTTKEPGRGTGQGLPLCWKIVVEGHGGTLTFRTRPGEGTTFVVRVPIAGKAEAPAPLARAVAA